MAFLFWPPIWHRVLRGDNDLEAFYVSGKLVGTGDLYDAAKFQSAERAFLGTDPQLVSIRPPFFAVAFWPLAQLPYRVAWGIWAGVLIAAVFAFIWLWPDRRAAALACCWSCGISASLSNGQDPPLVLVWLAIALRIHEERPFLAGLVLSLCAAKYHLFIFLPLLLWRHRLWRGFLAGAAVLGAISFAAAGWNWPHQYADLLLRFDSQFVHFAPQTMPNLHGLVSALPNAGVWEILACLLVAAGVFAVVRKADFATGLATVIAGGLLVSSHAYVYDCALLLPALLITLPALRGWTRAPLAWLLLPTSGLALLAGHPAGDITRAAILAFLGVLVYNAVRQPAFSQRPAVGLQLRQAGPALLG